MVPRKTKFLKMKKNDHVDELGGVKRFVRIKRKSFIRKITFNQMYKK